MIRFSNADVMRNLENVLLVIEEASRVVPGPTSAKSTLLRKVKVALGARPIRRFSEKGGFLA